MKDDMITRMLRWSGWLLVVTSSLVLVGLFGRDIFSILFSDDELPIQVWMMVVLYLGFGVLLLSVLRQRLIARRKDKYKDVEI